MGTDLKTTGTDLVVIPEPQISFALEAMRAYFIREHNFDGADTPLGHRWSNLVEQTWHLYFAQSPAQREHLMCAVARSTLEIRDIKRGQHNRLPMAREQLLLTFSQLH